MELGLRGRVALVTAASRGLGRAAARSLLAEGAYVVAVARGAEALAALAAEAPAGQVLTLPGDLEDPALPARAVAAAVERFGRLDILVANTAGPPARQPMEATEAEMEAAFRTVFFPAVRLVRAAVPEMAKAGWGRIVLVFHLGQGAQAVPVPLGRRKGRAVGLGKERGARASGAGHQSEQPPPRTA